MTNSSLDKHLHDLAKNIDYTLRIHDAKYVLVASDCHGEGKSTFLSGCTPVLSSLYKKRVLVYDCQNERDDILENQMSPSRGGTHHFIRSTTTTGLDYLHCDDLVFLNTLPDGERTNSLLAHFNEITRDYDVVFINMKTLKRAERSAIPALPIDGAILVRGPKTIGSKIKHVTNELLDREIPIIGLVKNEGLK